MIEKSREIWHRDDFSLLCNWRRLEHAVEVGVDRGEFAQEFLSRWRGEHFYAVDNYKCYEEMAWRRDGDRNVALVRLERYARIARLIYDDSLFVAKSMRESKVPIDFVYLDAGHDYDSVMADLIAWWETLSLKGIAAGHDFDKTHPGVMQAVSEFAKARELTVYLTHEPEIPSWYIYKSGMPGPDWRRC